MSGGNPFAELLGDFLLESRERVARVEVALLAIAEHPDSGRAAHVDLIKRELHTLKGNSGMMGMEEIQRLSHALEDDLESALEDDNVGTLLERLDALGELLELGAMELALGAQLHIALDLGGLSTACHVTLMIDSHGAEHDGQSSLSYTWSRRTRRRRR